MKNRTRFATGALAAAFVAAGIGIAVTPATAAEPTSEDTAAVESCERFRTIYGGHAIEMTDGRQVVQPECAISKNVAAAGIAKIADGEGASAGEEDELETVFGNRVLEVPAEESVEAPGTDGSWFKVGPFVVTPSV